LNLYQDIGQQLTEHYGEGEARALSRIIIEDILQMSFTRVIAGLEDGLTAESAEKVASTIDRLLKDEPIQHILGWTRFCGNEFEVSPDVLIPRPETERLVEIATSLSLPSENPLVMDACTGSGCIAVSIKLSKPKWQVVACDLSEPALQMAQNNANANGAEVVFAQVDVLSAERPKGPFDLIVSNPPYVMNKENSTMEPRVLEHEPAMALFVDDDDPLVFYRAIAEWGKLCLKPRGWIAVEINSALGKETSNLFVEHGYHEVRLEKDMFERDRFVICQK